MTSAEALTRVVAILNKYDKYDTSEEKKKEDEKNKKGPRPEDAFGVAFAMLEEDLRALQEKAESVKEETDRAAAATSNAEIRRAKNAIMTTDIPKLAKLAKKGKGLKKADVDARLDMIDSLQQSVQAVPDGLNARFTSALKPRKPTRLSETQMSDLVGNISASEVTHNARYYEKSQESREFEAEWKAEKKYQDESLDDISKGLSDLRGISVDIAEELDKQTPLVDRIDMKTDEVNAELKTHNSKLKKLVTEVRSTRNFCIDVTLICILLGIGGYIYRYDHTRTHKMERERSAHATSHTHQSIRALSPSHIHTWVASPPSPLLLLLLLFFPAPRALFVIWKLTVSLSCTLSLPLCVCARTRCGKHAQQYV